MPKYDGVNVTLGGAEYTVPPLTLGAIRRLMPRINAMSGAKDGTLNGDMLDAISEVAHAALVRNYPEMTRETLDDLIDLKNVQSLTMAIMGASGLVQVKADQGEAEGPTPTGI